MGPIQNFESHSRQLLDPDVSVSPGLTPMQARHNLAVEVRDSLEIAHTAEYLNFLKWYFQAFSMILLKITKPQSSDNTEHKLRNVIVEILNRLPHSEVLRPFVQDLLKVAMQVLTTDNEENGLICIRIIFDLLRNFRPTLETEVQPFLDFVCKIYQNFSATVSHFFESGAVKSEDVRPMDTSDQGISPPGTVYSGTGELNPSTRSFKIVTESPLVVMFLFQLYGRLVQTNIPHLLPLMVAAISVRGPEKVPPHLKPHFLELKGAQVKTVSFLTYLLKSFADYIRPHEESICRSIVNLLVTCSDSVSTRKELLVALKHVLGTDFKRGLFPLIDTLLEERVLVGPGRACFETLRPLAYSLLAEIVHHVRGDLSLSQLSRIIYLFSSNMHDASLSLSIHTTCARLMLNLVEPIFEKGVDQPSMDEARILLGRILDAFVGKFSTFKRTIPQLLEEGEDGKERATLKAKLELPVQAVLNMQVPIEHAKEVNDCKHLIKTLVMGMKTIIWSITHAHIPRPQVSSSAHGTHQQVLVSPSTSMPASQGFKGMREDEVSKAAGVLKSGVHCLALFKEKDEEREMLHLFSQILAIMEPRDLMDMFSLCMPELFECMISNTQLVHIFSTLLQANKVYRPFADVLVNFLVSSKLDVLKNPDSPAAKLVLQLFWFIFGAVAKAPAEFERILQPHVPVIMETCIKSATEVEKPLAYMQLLRMMFRPLSGCKFELLLRELVPMLQPCLNMLLTMLEGPTGEDMRDLLLELCLTLPARLSSLLPYLTRLMKPLVWCLKGSDDLVSLGLRTLEFWVDSLNPDFLEPSMANVMSEVILALWSHLRPPPYPWGGKSLQLLGKLGGRNRRFLKEPLALECKDNPEHGLRLILTFEPQTPFLVPLDRFINLAVAAVMNKNGGIDAFYRKQALKFLRVCLSSQLNLPGNVADEGYTPKQLSTLLVSNVDASWRRSESLDIKADLGVKTKTQLMAEKSVFKILLMTIIAASAEPDLHDPKDDFLSSICRHFAMIFYIDHLSSNPAAGAPSISSTASVSTRSRSSGSNLKELDPLIFLDALVDVLADENRLRAKAAVSALNVFAETLLFLARTKHADVMMSRAGPSTPMIVSSPSMNPVYSPPPSVRIPVFEQLLPRLLHCCYGNTWQAQMGGVMGLSALVGKVTVETLCLFQVKIVRALVYVLKKLPTYATKEQEETSQVLTQVLRVVNNVDDANSEPRKQSFQGVVEFLAQELFNSNASLTVRKNVQSCLALLASRTGSEVSELLEPLYQPLLQPLIVRPLRSKTIDQQVGTVTALNFCLALRPPLLKLTQELVSFLQEALQIAEADENVWVVKFMNPKVATSLNKLRTACIELLCTTMAWADFKTPNHSELRAKIISMFFKSLTCRTPEIVAVAKEGLRQVINQQRMPKELLQSSLRPILVNLAHTKNLSMPLLQGLARLLELLSNWFNVTLGGKLLEHLKKWLEPEKLAQSQKSWKAGEEPKIASAIIELFHLLPNAASKFLDELVTLTIDLEGALPPGQVYSEINSPYRLPLTKFLNKYAAQAVDYFLARLGQPKYFRRFMYIIRSDAGQTLRDELAKSPQKILANAFPEFMPKSEPATGPGSTATPAAGGDEGGAAPPPDGSKLPASGPASTSDGYFQGLALIKTLVKLIPGWLQSNRIVFDTLVHIWKSPARIARLRNEQELDLVQVKESKWLVKCFLNYLRQGNTELNVLFDVLSIFLFHTRIDFTFLKEFYIIEVAEGYPPAMKKSILLHFLNLFQSKQLGHSHLVVVMQMLILPMLAHAFQNGQTWEVIDAGIIKTIVEKLLDPPEEVSAEYDEPLRIELLQLATLLLKYLQTDLVQHRKELIKFGWNHLKREDSASKQWAFVNVCHFLEAYQAPEKIILQVFVALLRTCQPENKMLVKQALDILMPALPRRLPQDPRMPIWIRYTKKILVEEGHSIPNLIHIFQLIVRHSDLFYSCRAQFVPQMVNSLSRLGLPYNTTSENRRLAIELAGLVVGWERQRQNEMKVVADPDAPAQNSEGLSNAIAPDPKRPVDGPAFSDDLSKRVKVEPGLQAICVMSPGGPSSIPNIETPGPSGQPDEEFKPNAAMEEMIINFLIRVALVIEPKDKEASNMYKQALELLSQALEVWPNANVKFNYLEKLLSSIQPSQSKDPSTALAQGLDVMNKVLEKQPHLFIRNNINQISQILEPCFKYKMLDAGKSLCSLLKMVFIAFPLDVPTTPQDVKLLYQKVDELIQKHISAVTSVQATVEDNSSNSISFVLLVMKTLNEVHKNFTDPHILVRILQRLARDMSSSAGSHLKQGQRTDADSAVTSSRQGADVGAVISNLKSALKLINERVMLVPDCKRSTIQTLNVLLSEKGTDPSVLLCILDVIKGWIEDDFNKMGSSAFLSSKEIVAFLQKLSQVDKQNFSPSALEEWDSKYLQLLYGICSNEAKYPLALRQEVFQKVERQYMLGLRARDPEMRKKFFALYNESIGKTLFARLQYIIQIQDWEALGDVFWLKQGLDLLLAILVVDKPITLASNSARVSPLVSSSSPDDSTTTQPMVTDVPEGSEDAPLTFDGLVLKHAKFLNEMSKLQVADLVVSLRELAHTDPNVAYHLWVLVFPIVWVTLHKEEQVTLAKPMITLLSKDYHKKQQTSRPNVVQALLEGLQLSHPQPRMPSELIKYIGKTYNAWHIALALLESHVMLFMNETKCSESLAELYRLLNEEDMRCGLWKKRSVTAETKAGLSLVQHGYWNRAQSLFYQAMVKATQGTYNNTVPKAEMCLWEEQWLHCATQLSQWDALVDFGKSVENYEILLDSLWKLPDWSYLKDQVIPKAQVEETPKLRLIQAFFALHDRNTNGVTDAENMVGKGVDLALEQWWQLPEMSVHARVSLLQQFQQLVEVQESARVLMDISNGNKQHSGNSMVGAHGSLYADLKDILETWRLRTPNEWDNMSVWYDLLQWRNEMYNVVIDAFKDFGSTNPQLHHLGYRDKAWNVNKLAHIARKQGLYDVCVTILEKMYGHSTMEVQEAFVKISEQAKAYLETKGELNTGLNLINSTNLEYFPPKHKAEIFRIKGDFLLKLNDSEGANLAYSNALSLFKNLPKGWISWGSYCDMAYKESHDEIWLEYAVSCFLQGIRFGVSNSRSHLARVLYLLSFDTPNEPVGRAFDKCLDQIPHWVWLSWIPQLLLSLQRTEAPHCKLVLLKIATVYPQALYYWLRTYLLERRDVANKSEHGRMAMAQQRMQQNMPGPGAGSLGHSGPALAADNQGHQSAQSSSGGMGPHDGGSHGQEPDRSAVTDSSIHSGNEQQSMQQGSSNMGDSSQNALRRNSALGLVASAASAFDAAKDIMEALRSKHSNLATELEILLTEIGSRFVTLPEERLLAVVNALLHRCYKYPTATTAEVPQSLKKELSGVCRACFSADAVNKHVEFVREYKQEFERDLDPESTTTFPSTLSELTERLKNWKNILQSNVEDRFPAVLKLEEESRVLRDFHVVDVEVPGQYFTDQEIAPDHTVKLDRVGADIPIVRRHGSSFRRLTLIGSDGSQRHFIVQTSLPPNARSDERILQLFRVMNQMFDKHKESRRRHLYIHTPIIIPVWSQVRMVEDDLMYSTFLEVYENHCARNDREADLPITYFKEQLNQAISGQVSPEAVVDLRLQAYNDITKNLVTDNIFSQYMYKTLHNGNHMWAFKKQFAVQLALSSFMSFMLQIGGRSPNKILFAKNTGKIFQTDFHPAYDANGMIEFNEPVPFRLTRNMQAFFSHFGVEGLIVSSMCAAAQAVTSPKQYQHLWHQLAMFFRDELLSWSWRRPLGMPMASLAGGGSLNPADFKHKITNNVEHVIGRINRISPQFYSEEDENAMDPPQSVQRGVMELVEAALTPRNLCMMDPTWHPWF
ncbi:transformation/transcription domain-associated protein isoform X1 [Punica granatum]|uniref:Transformation/transcription domain-associated protein isoform X1 n=1 Tax=Punica granatum TaxID=22663 RepID=A0A6P8E2C4_PUNGR|nr:transformation/transcription domain-associated protein isoform X1 [Punica granatum]